MKKSLMFFIVLISIFSLSSCSVEEIKKSNITNYKITEIQLDAYYIDDLSHISDKRIRIHNGKEGVNKRYGLIDSQGKVIVEPKYLNAFIFSEGLAFVIDEDKLGQYIDINGKTALEFIENRIIGFGDIFKDGYATVYTFDRDNNRDIVSIINKNGETILSSEMRDNNLQNDGSGFFEIFSPSSYDERKIVDSLGNIINEDGITLVYPDENGNGFYTKNHDVLGIFYQGDLKEPIFKQVTKAEENYSIVETSNNEIWIVDISDQSRFELSDKYENIDSSSLNDISGKRFAINFSDDQKSIILNTDGELVAETDCDMIYNFENGVAKFLSKSKYGLIDNNGMVILEAEYNYISNINDGVVLLYNNDKWYIVTL